MEQRASIAIYQRAVETEDETCPITPDEVFEAAKEVSLTRGTKIVRNRTGVFVITYSETGPFTDRRLAQDWLPVQVYMMKQWASGGIKESEMRVYDENYENTNHEIDEIESNESESHETDDGSIPRPTTS
jgi:hypothetical protein